MKRSKKDVRVPPDTYRVIKISGDALLEFLHECMIDNQEIFFDVGVIDNAASIVTCFDVDWKAGSMVMIARNIYEDGKERLQFPDEMDTQQLLQKLPDTVNTMYSSKKRYRDMTLDEIIRVQQ